MESTRSEIKYEIERSQNKKKNANDTRYGRTGARCGRSPGKSRLAFSTEKVSSTAIAGFAAGFWRRRALRVLVHEIRVFEGADRRETGW